jgi:hypothetical protein
MIVLTFDDAINYENWELYDKVLLNNWKNPNGCSIKATFFVSHQFNNYHQTQKLWNEGHEVAVHSVTYVTTHPDFLCLTIAFSGIEPQKSGGRSTPLLRIGSTRWWVKLTSCTSSRGSA